MPGKLKLFVLLAVLVSLSGMAAAAWLTPRFYAHELAMELPLSRADWAESTTCRSCHPDHYASWHRTFHRTMTQEANPRTVRGRFDGKPVTYWGVTIRPYEDHGRYFFEYLDPASDHRLRTLEILRTGARAATSNTSRSSPTPPAPTCASSSCGTSRTSAGCT